MEKEQINKYIEFIEPMLIRPLMYFGKYDTDVVTVYFHGMYDSLKITNQSFPNSEIHQQAAKNLGWNYNALGIVPHMNEKNLTNEEMVKELVSLEIEAWKIFRDNLEK